jgi:hypothetical protein
MLVVGEIDEFADVSDELLLVLEVAPRLGALAGAAAVGQVHRVAAASDLLGRVDVPAAMALDPVQVDERTARLPGRREDSVRKRRTVPGGQRSDRLL